MNKLTHKVVVAAAFAIVGSLGSSQVFALGFKNPDQDARATGQGEAFVAQADDASAIYYNPGGLTQIQGTEVTSGAMLAFPDSRLKGAGSGGEMNTMAFLPHLYAVTDFGAAQSPWRFGLGFNVPFGNQAEFSDNGPFRYIVTQASLAVFNIQPTVAYQINEHLSLGAGLNIYDGTTDLKRNVDLSGFGLPDGHVHFDGDGQAFGATVGLMWKITPQHTVGVVYRSPFKINFDGHASVNLPVIGTESKPANASIQFPQSVAGGYAFRPTKKLKLEADIEWTNWEMLHKVVLHEPGGTPGLSLDGTTIPFDWQDSLFYEFGAQYEVDDHWTVRGGYIYSENTVPNSSFSPTVPDSNRHVFSVGLGYSVPRFTVDIVYQYSLSENRTVSNGTAADGTWESDGHMVMVTSSLKF
jgi:long-chain fatty acid transport protein